MRIDNEFTVNATLDVAWELLNDIPRITPCLPGASLNGVEGDTYRGNIRVKVGPVVAEYLGSAEVTNRDDREHIVTIAAMGRETKGSGTASADISASMVEVAGATVVTLVTDLKVSGKVAQFGRGVIADVSKRLMMEFSDSLASLLSDAQDSTDLGACSQPVNGRRNESDEQAPVNLFAVAVIPVLRRVAVVGLVATVVVGVARAAARKFEQTF